MQCVACGGDDSWRVGAKSVGDWDPCLLPSPAQVGTDSFDITVAAKPAAGRDNWRFDFGDGFISADFVVGASSVTVVPEGGFAGESLPEQQMGSSFKWGPGPV